MDGKSFYFDKVFGFDSSQSSVFDEVKPLASSLLDGYNCCLFAYGQTGSGKTYTMEGPDHDRGVNYRMIKELFELSEQRQHKFEFTMSIFEIYNEQILDLLSNDTKKVLKVRPGPNGMCVPDATMKVVKCVESAWEVIEEGHKMRFISSTDMNERSSRSHCVSCIEIVGTNPDDHTQIRSKLFLVDLAGSERVSQSGAKGKVLGEARCINKSLSALTRVIESLASKKSHIPFRDSVLTFLLQDSLSGNSKTCVFLQLSPSQDSISQSLCTLNFGLRVKKIELGSVRRNFEIDKKMLSTLKSKYENEKLSLATLSQKFTSDIQKKEAELEQFKKELNKKNKLIQKIESELDSKDETIKELNLTLESKNKEIAKLQAMIQRYKLENEQLSKKVNKSKSNSLMPSNELCISRDRDATENVENKAKPKYSNLKKLFIRDMNSVSLITNPQKDDDKSPVYYNILKDSSSSSQFSRSFSSNDSRKQKKSITRVNVTDQTTIKLKSCFLDKSIPNRPKKSVTFSDDVVIKDDNSVGNINNGSNLTSFMLNIPRTPLKGTSQGFNGSSKRFFGVNKSFRSVSRVGGTRTPLKARI